MLMLLFVFFVLFDYSRNIFVPLTSSKLLSFGKIQKNSSSFGYSLT